MGLNDTPVANRIHIGFFGRRNAGKSSLVNAVAGQTVSVVSDVAGTTTDPVKKTMELLPLGPANALLMLIYGLFGLAVAATVVAAVFQFGAALKDSPANAIKSLLGLVLLVVVLVIAWAAGDGTPMNIPGYDGTDNVPFWLKLTDMFLYSIYILLFVTIVAIIASGIKKKIS